MTTRTMNATSAGNTGRSHRKIKYKPERQSKQPSHEPKGRSKSDFLASYDFEYDDKNGEKYKNGLKQLGREKQRRRRSDSSSSSTSSSSLRNNQHNHDRSKHNRHRHSRSLSKERRHSSDSQEEYTNNISKQRRSRSSAKDEEQRRRRSASRSRSHSKSRSRSTTSLEQFMRSPSKNGRHNHHNHKSSKNKKAKSYSHSSSTTKATTIAKKVGTFRPYHVPIKKRMYRRNSKDYDEGLLNTEEGNINNLSTDIPGRTFYKAMKSISVASFLHDGIPVYKISKNHSNWQKRILTLSRDQTCLFLTHQRIKQSKHNSNSQSSSISTVVNENVPIWTPTKGWNNTQQYLRSLDISDIYYWQVGVVSSKTLELSIKQKQHYKYELKHGNNKDATRRKQLQQKGKKGMVVDPDPLTVGAIVTIYYKSKIPKTEISETPVLSHQTTTTSMMETLDLFIMNPDHRRGLVATLQLLHKTQYETSQLISMETLRLLYMWKDLVLSNNKNLIQERDFIAMCQKLQFCGGNSNVSNTTITDESNTNKVTSKRMSVNKIGKEFRSFCKQLKQEQKEQLSMFQNKNRSIKNTNDQIQRYNKGLLSSYECMRLIQQIKSKHRHDKPSIEQHAWTAIFGPNINTINSMTILMKFLHGPQKEQSICDITDAEDIIAAMNATEILENALPTINTTTNDKLTRVQFEEFLRSEWNDIYDPEKLSAKNASQHPLNKPISQYWIKSSHNSHHLLETASSYGDGLDATQEPVISVQGYTMALERGYKAIEVVCWDNNVPTTVDSEWIPIVSNTGNIKTSISFKSVVLVCLTYLKMNPSSYPIILNIENHCTLPFQKAMAKILKQHFGNFLFTPSSIHRTKQLPSPQELIGMVVVNLTRPSSDLNDDKTSNGHNQSSSNGGESKETDVYTEMFQKFNAPAKPKSSRLISFLPETAAEGVLSSFQSKRELSVESGEYANELLTLTMFHDTSFSGFFEESLDLICSHMHSIEDHVVPNIAAKYENNPELWRKYNETHLTRIYSNISQKEAVNNYSPVLAWSMGCQMASLKNHVSDSHLALNDGFFRRYGGIGYVEKPASLCGEEKPPCKRLKIRILSGSCLPMPKPQLASDEDILQNPYVIFECHDVSIIRDQERPSVTTHKVECKNDDTSNGFCPIFHDKGKEIVVETPAVAVLVFQVMDHVYGTVGSAAVPVDCLRRGYRSVQLYDSHGCRRQGFVSSLLVYLQY